MDVFIRLYAVGGHPLTTVILRIVDQKQDPITARPNTPTLSLLATIGGLGAPKREARAIRAARGINTGYGGLNCYTSNSLYSL